MRAVRCSRLGRWKVQHWCFTAPETFSGFGYEIEICIWLCASCGANVLIKVHKGEEIYVGWQQGFAFRLGGTLHHHWISCAMFASSWPGTFKGTVCHPNPGTFKGAVCHSKSGTFKGEVCHPNPIHFQSIQITSSYLCITNNKVLQTWKSHTPLQTITLCKCEKAILHYKQ